MGLWLVFTVALVLQCSAREILTKKFRSPAIKLKSGQIANTPNDFGPLPFPEGPVAITYFKGDVVDDTGKSVPLYDVYVHHWLIFAYNQDFTFPLHNPGVCGPLMNVWGIGAELRGTAYEYPEPYALLTTGKENWSGNLHFIRTTNVDPEDIQDCIECRCPDSNPPTDPDGGVSCCPDGGQCYSMESWPIDDSKNYYLEYEIRYSTDLTGIIPITVYSFDATAKHTYDCRIEYNIPGPLAVGEYNKLEHTEEIPTDMEIVYMQSHQHIGGVNFTVEHISGSETKRICFHSPEYGTGTEPGNEKDYLVKIPYCAWPASLPLKVKKGDMFRLTSYYDGRTLPAGHRWHAGVMALLYVHAKASPSNLEACLSLLHTDCGKPPYKERSTCIDCAQTNYHALFKAGCDVEMIEDECSKTGSGGDVPPPSAVNQMTLNIQQDGKDIKCRASAPADSWFGIAFNPKGNIMTNATAFVYGNDEATGSLEFQERILGNHAAGVVKVKNFPNTIETKDSIVTLTWTFKDVELGEKNCWLFAQGDVMEGLKFQYHGFARGSSCGYPTVTNSTQRFIRL